VQPAPQYTPLANMKTVMQLVENVLATDLFVDFNRPCTHSSDKKPRSLSTKLRSPRVSTFDIMKWEWQIIQHLDTAFRSGHGITYDSILAKVKIDTFGNVVSNSIIDNCSEYTHAYEAVMIQSVVKLHDSMYRYAKSCGVLDDILYDLAMFSTINNHMYASVLRANPEYSMNEVMDMAKFLYEAFTQGIIMDIEEEALK
jgi:hypothetical protein